MDSWPSVLDWVDTINSGIFCVDALGNISLWNQAMVELLGYTSDELRNSSLLRLLCDDDDQVMTKLLRKEKIATDHFVKMTHKSNHQILAKITVCSQRRNNGEWIGHLFFVADQRTRFHDETAESPAFNDENNIVSIRGVANSGMDDLCRECASDKFDSSLFKEVSEKDLSQCLDYREQEQAKWISSASLQNTHNDNHHASTNSLNLRNQREDTSDKLITTQDLSDTLINQRSSESLLYTILVELSELFEQANTPIFGVDVTGVVNEWNIQMSTTTGYCKEDSIHQNFAETYVAVSFRQKFQEIMGNCLQGCQTSSFELDIVTSDGHTRHLLVNGTTRRDFFGKIVGVLFFAQDITERLQHDRAVAAIARELRQLIDTANAPIFGIDINGRVNEWNDKTAEITGFSADEAFNQPLVETFIVPAFQSSVNRVLRDALEGSQTSNYELEFRTKDNEIRYLLLNATTRKDAENNVIGVVGVAQDVTEAAMHDRAVAVMANELRQLIDAANAPIFGIDIDGDVNEWNNKTAEITGYTKEEAFDCNLVDTFIVPTHRASVTAVMDKALKGEEASNYELEFRTKSNEIRYLLVNATTRRDAENSVVGVVGVAQDVTETVHRDRAVASMAKELRQLIETANAPIFGIDFDGNVNEWNYKIAEVTGYSKKEAFDQPLVETFIAPLMRDQVSKIMNEALSGIETSNYELEMLTKSKEIRVLLVNATTRRDPDDNVVGGKLIQLIYFYFQFSKSHYLHGYS
jgi:PAS domain S-box-containing protein